jgi:hypothetical protein
LEEAEFEGSAYVMQVLFCEKWVTLKAMIVENLIVGLPFNWVQNQRHTNAVYTKKNIF